MRLKPILAIVGALLAVTLAAACNGGLGKYKSDFSIIVVNRTANALQILANGGEIGQVAAGQQGTFSLTLAETNANRFEGGVAPTPQSEITITAKDMRTGLVSEARTLTLSGNAPSSITFTSADFPATAPTIARFSVSPINPGPEQLITFNASASSPNTATFTWNFGDGTSGRGITTTKRYAQPGTFVVTLTLTTETGLSATASSNVNVTTILPRAAVNFTFSPLAPAINQEVFFNASTSTASGTFNWDFGDGETATGVTTTHRFPRAGTYAVTLTVRNNAGQSASMTRAVSVAATSPLVAASFTFSPTNPGINQEVFFDAEASRPQNATFSWNFGDGSTGVGITTSHRFTQAGTRTVTLTVTNDVGQTATTTRTITVSATSNQVFASFVFSPTAPGINQEIFFDAAASRPQTGTFTWDFGDGTRGSGVTPTHRYGAVGTYVVLLTVANEIGQTATTTRTLTILATSTQVFASFTVSPTSAAVNQEIFLDASASRPADGGFSWNFGDGTGGTGVRPTHRYTQPGTYTITLTVTNAFSQRATTTRTITISATSAQVVASFTFSPTTPAVNQEVFFNSSASSPANGTFNWSFGDGTTGVGNSPTHRYAQAGSYTITLRVTNENGQAATTTRTITVSATSGDVTASFTFSPTTAGVNQEVFFNASASLPTNGTYAWNFGDGTAAGSGVTPTHRYAQAGTYTVTLTVTNSNGQSATSSRTITVSATSTDVVANFTFSPTSPGLNQEVFFNGSGSTPSNASFAWSFGDGSTGTGVTPTHRYTLGGTYTITLTVTFSGQTSTTSRTVTVASTSTQIVVSFSYSPTSPSVGTQVFYNASASSAPSGIAGYAWDFGDGCKPGSESTGTCPTGSTNGVITNHTYQQAGTYVIRLTIRDTDGNSNTSTNTVTVTVTQ